MSDTVKFIIEIPKVPKNDHERWVLVHGTPLDYVTEEIEKLNPVDYGSMFSYESHNGARDMKRDILEILDRIGKESETN